jgi:hypothetical protein
MKAERARLMRLRRLEKVRGLAKQAAAQDAAKAESTLAQLELLAARSRDLASDYARRGGARDGAALQQLGRFAGGLQHIADGTASQASHARELADGKLAELARAERRRALAEERADLQSRTVARKATGTGLE